MTAEFSISLVDVQGVWVSSLVPGPEKQGLPWKLQQECGASKNFPLAACFNLGGENRGTFSCTDIWDDSRICIAVNQEMGCYDFVFTLSLSEKTEPFKLVIDRKPGDWQDAVKRFRESLGFPQYSYPAAAWDPVYCTWYVVHGAVTQDFVEAGAKVATELGFTTLIVDDGWCYDDMKRVSPTTIASWYEMIGDWEISNSKFPDFKAHVKRVQDMGMKYMLWVAPHLWGFKSELYRSNPGMTIGQPIEGYDKMDINRADFSGLVEKLRRLAADNDLDGLKIDFIDIVPPNVDNPNARATEKLVADLTGALKTDNPDALIEFRQSYSTMATLKYATQFRAGDVPFNYLMNFGRLVELRLAIGNAAPVHADPAYWAFGEKSINVARHMMAMLVGVPMLSMDLNKLTDIEKRIIRYYVDFYNAHRQLINHGSWRMLFGQSDVDAAIVDNGSEKMAVLCDAGRFAECVDGDKPVWIMNLSPRDIVCNCQNAVDTECNPVNGVIPAGGSGLVIAG